MQSIGSDMHKRGSAAHVSTYWQRPRSLSQHHLFALGITSDNTIECRTKVRYIAFRLHHRECCGFANWLRYPERYPTAHGLSRVARGTTYSDFYPEDNYLSKPAFKFMVLIHNGIHACFISIQKLRCRFNSQRNTTYLTALYGRVH